MSRLHSLRRAIRYSLHPIAILLIVVQLSACGSGQGSNALGNTAAITDARIPTTGDNVMQVWVGNCGGQQYVNEICASVTICAPGTTNCQTIPNLLVDTGSYGLRVFSSVLSSGLLSGLSNESITGKTVAECVGFADGSSQWGTVATADIILGNETASSVPFQLLNASYSGAPTACSNADTGPAATGFNGILGVGLLSADCGSGCATAPNSQYYTCASGSCSQSAVPIAKQVTNPVSMVGADGNGVLLQLPALPTNGGYSARGALVLGIGTRSNNTPGGVTFLPVSSSGYITTSYNSSNYTRSFIDSGSNGIYASLGSISICSDASSFYCPSSVISLNATMKGYGVSTTVAVPFSVISADAAFYSGEYAFNNLAGTMSSSYFDWGLPFFFGRNVYIGITNTTSTLGTGPYWAF